MEKLKRGKLRADVIQAKKKKTRRIILITAIIVCLIIGLVLVTYMNQTKTYNSFQTGQTIELSNLEGCSFAGYKNGILKLNRDGAETISADGKQLWNVAYNMKNPIADVKGSYAVIGDLGGKSAYIVNGSGTANEINLTYTIVDVKVAAQGVAAICTSNGMEDYIYLYGMDSKNELAVINSKTSTDGFPIDIALSDDGQKVVSSYVKVDTDSTTTQLTFHNFGEVGKNYGDHLVGAWPFKGEFIPTVEFITNDVVAAYKDTGLWMFSMKEIPKEIMTETYTENIKSIFYQSGYLGVVLEDSSGTGENQLLIYSTAGKKMADAKIDFSYDKVLAGDEYLVFYNNLECHVLNMKGKEEFQHTFKTSINQLFQGRNAKEFFAVTDTSLEVIGMSQTKEE